ncbi:hypothetical protein BSKO_09386 [Bryopsis sp. KO-2023]|nr:hypothetical protein BSKO_09386 [Bryopsis sp. KO-2023]
MAPKDELLKQVQMVLEERRALHSESDSDSEGDSESASDDEQEAGSPRQAEDEQGMQGGSSRISDTTLAAEAEGRQSSQTSEEETEDHESDDSSRVYDASFPKSVAADKGSFHMSAAERKELRGKLKEGIEDLKFRAMEAELKQKDPLLGLT